MVNVAVFDHSIILQDSPFLGPLPSCFCQLEIIVAFQRVAFRDRS